MSNTHPLTIRRGSFVCDIYDVGNLMRLPLANVRKLWKIMFSAEDENRETIQTLRSWLLVNVTQTKEQQAAYASLLEGECTAAETVRRTVAAFGGVATKEQKEAVKESQRRVRSAEKKLKAATAAHVKAQKLQTIFNDLTTK